MNPNTHPIQIAIAAANKLDEFNGLRCRTYSGRAMWGNECLAVEAPDLGEFVAGLYAGSRACDREVPGDFDESMVMGLETLRIDTLGHGIIVYFPGVTYVDPRYNDDEDDAPEEEAGTGEG